jgi:hypothetical protein
MRIGIALYLLVLIASAIVVFSPAQLMCRPLLPGDAIPEGETNPYLCRSVRIYQPEYWGSSLRINPMVYVDSFNRWFDSSEKYVQEKLPF